jgi:hypothetical protein
MVDRAIRKLNNINHSASTSRVLNLNKIFNMHGHDPEYAEKPLFHNRFLNQSIILKHRLRQNEMELFEDHRSVVTKIILPIDRLDLRAGGQYMFLGQRGEDAVLSHFLSDSTSTSATDRKVLAVLDSLPSFDPFLVREHLRRKGFEPAACYFNISPADQRRMLGFVEEEISELAGLSVSGSPRLHESVTALAQKLMSNETAEEMEPLRTAMRMDRISFVDGLFAWKGLLYYKWVLMELNQQLPYVMFELRQIKASGPVAVDVQAYLGVARRRINTAVARNMMVTRNVLDVYDKAYRGLTRGSDPLAFREFLMNAPHFFLELGETLGVLSHVVSYWKFRFKKGAPAQVNALELNDILMDFDLGLSGTTSTPQAADGKIYMRMSPRSRAVAVR